MKSKEAKKKSDFLKIAQGLGVAIPVGLLSIGNADAMNTNIKHSDEVVVGDMMSVHNQNPISYNYGCSDDCDKCVDTCDGCSDKGCTDRCVDSGCDRCSDCVDKCDGCSDKGCTDRCVDNCDK
jgi:hypothetical protein